MRRFVCLAVLLFFTVPFGMSVIGCGRKTAAVEYCSAGDSGPVVGQVAYIQLPVSLATVGESLNYGQIGQSLSASAFDCRNNSVSVRSFTYASSDLSIADINPSTGQVCAGTWNRFSGGGVADYTFCTPPANPGNKFVAYLTATAEGSTSNVVPVYVHPVATSVAIGTPTPNLTYSITGYTTGTASTTFNTSSPPPSLNEPVLLSGFANSTFLNGQLVVVTASNSTSPYSFAVANTFGKTASVPTALTMESGTATSRTVCAATNDPSSNCCASNFIVGSSTSNVSIPPPAYTGSSCLSQGTSAQLNARVYANGTTNPADNITCRVGHLTFSPQNSSNIATIDPATGIVTANQPGSATVIATIANAGSGSTAGFLATCPPASIVLSAPGKTGSNINVALNNQQAFTTTVLDTNGNTITGLSLEFNSTTPQTIPTSGASVTPAFPGTATITAACNPGTCNPAPFSQIGLYGTGKPVTSNGITVSAAGTSSTVIYAGSTSSQYIYPVDFTTSQPPSLVKLPFVPNSMVITQDGSTIYLGSSQALMTVSTASNAVGGSNTTVTGKVLSVSPDGSTVVVSDAARQTTSLVSSSGSVTATYGAVGTAAQWAPDSQTVYITAVNNQLLVHSSFTGWSNIATAATYNDVAVTVPHIGAYFSSGSLIDGRSYCASSTVTAGNPPTVANAFYPLADEKAIRNDHIAATTDGAHILGATASTTPATLNDLAVTLPTQSVSGVTTIAACPLPTQTQVGPGYFQSNNSTHVLTGVTATAINSVVPASNSALAFVTYTGTSGLLPLYVPATGAVTFVALSGGTGSAPVSGVFSTDNLTFYAGTSGDNKVHLINVNGTTATDGSTISPNLPDPSGAIVAPNLIAQRPKRSTS